MALGRTPQIYYNTRQWLPAVPTPSRGLGPSCLPIPALLFLLPALPRSSLTALAVCRSWADLQQPQLCAACRATLGSGGSPPRKPSHLPLDTLQLGWFLCTPMYLPCSLPHMLSSAHALTHRWFHSLSTLCSNFKYRPCLRADEQSCSLLWHHLTSQNIIFLLLLPIVLSDSEI